MGEATASGGELITFWGLAWRQLAALGDLPWQPECNTATPAAAGKKQRRQETPHVPNSSSPVWIVSHMPTSVPRQISLLRELVRLANSTSALDIGVGFGKYGVLLREYMDVCRGRYDRPLWQARLDGIEVHAAYANPIWSFVYNDMFIGDALSIVPALKNHYDVVLAIDVIEHFDRQ